MGTSSVRPKSAGLRDLGPLERYSVIRSHLGIYLNVCVTATYRRRSAQPLKSALYQALASVISKHPILATVPVGIPPTPRFERLELIDLDEVVTFLSPQAPATNDEDHNLLDRILEEQHSKGFEDRRRPFWRICIIQDIVEASRFTLVFCFHHSLADTISAMVFHEDLEQALSNPPEFQPSKIVFPEDAILLPPLESLMELPTSPEFLERQRHLGEPPAHVWSGAPQRTPSVTRFSSLWVSSRTLTELQLRCKREQTSPTAAFMAIIATAFFQTLPDEYSVLYGDCAVSLRRFVSKPVSARSMGCYVGSFSHAYTRGSCSTWENARATKRTIEAALSGKGADMPVGYLSYLPDMAQWFGEKMGKRRWAAWELSNVGALGGKAGPGLSTCEIESVLFSQSASSCSGAIKVSMATGRDGRLGVGFSWQQGVVEDEVVMALIANVRELIAQETSESA